jgi:hypothetical protein
MPFGDTPSAPGAAVWFAKVGDVVGVVTGIDDGADATVVGWPWSELEEQPARRAAAAATATIG